MPLRPSEQTAPSAGGTAFINTGEFAAYTFTVVVAISALTLLGAVARRISGRGHPAVGAGSTDPGARDSVAQLAAELDTLRDEVGVLRRELDETQNRLDFTERLLAQARERGLLAAPKER